MGNARAELRALIDRIWRNVTPAREYHETDDELPGIVYTSFVVREQMRARLAAQEAELAELRKKVSEAPVAWIDCSDHHGPVIPYDDIRPLDGKRVALVEVGETPTAFEYGRHNRWKGPRDGAPSSGDCPKCGTRVGVHGGCDCGYC